VGMLGSKDLGGFLTPLAPVASTLRAVAVPDEAASRDPQEIAAAALQLGIPAAVATDVASAVEQIVAEETASYRILICGSLYLAGHVLRENG
jgi:dihydrofolate synthase / folylpolyglutamate synthase